jgi:outer membrane protein TolC
MAQKGSDAVKLRELALQKSRLAVNEASSRLWPRVSLQASASYLANPPQGYTVSKGELGTITLPFPPFSLAIPQTDFTIGAQQHDYFSLSVSLSQPVFTWGKIRNAVDLASLQAEAAGTDLAAQRRDVRRDTHGAYFGAVLARESVQTLARLRDVAAGIAADTQAAFDQGTVNREAVLRAAADRASLEAKLAEADQSLATALESLSVLTGAEAAADALTTGFRAALPEIDETALLARARSTSTEIAAARARTEMARKKLDIEKGGSLLLPDVSLGVNLDVSGQEDLPFAAWDASGKGWNWDVVITLGVKTSVVDGGASAARIAQAEQDAAMAGVAVAQADTIMRLSVRRAVEALLKADAGVKDRQARAEYAAERLKNARASFDNGVASRDELRGADIQEGSARLDLLLALYTRERAIAEIECLVGGPVEAGP